MVGKHKNMVKSPVCELVVPRHLREKSNLFYAMCYIPVLDCFLKPCDSNLLPGACSPGSKGHTRRRSAE